MYRRRGLDANGRRIVGFVARRGVEGATVLDVGGGNGALGLELLKAGAERAITVELSSSYDTTATELAREAGFEDRIERRIIDFAEAAEELPEGDVVVMHRVVCCYPEGESLVAAAAGRARRILAFSLPAPDLVDKARRHGRQRRPRCTPHGVPRLHPPPELLLRRRRASRGGQASWEHDDTLWRVAGFERAS